MQETGIAFIPFINKKGEPESPEKVFHSLNLQIRLDSNRSFSTSCRIIIANTPARAENETQ